MKNIKSQIKNLDLSNLKTSNSKSIASELRKHASILANCIMYQLNLLYDSYEPKIYQRTYNLYNSVYVDNRLFANISAKGLNLSIHVCFDGGAWHEGLDGKNVNTAILLNEGWQTSGKFKDIPYFGYREPSYFIEKAVEQYKQKVSKPFNVKINKDYT